MIYELVDRQGTSYMGRSYRELYADITDDVIATEKLAKTNILSLVKTNSCRLTKHKIRKEYEQDRILFKKSNPVDKALDALIANNIKTSLDLSNNQDRYKAYTILSVAVGVEQLLTDNKFTETDLEFLKWVLDLEASKEHSDVVRILELND